MVTSISDNHKLMEEKSTRKGTVTERSSKNIYEAVFISASNEPLHAGVCLANAAGDLIDAPARCQTQGEQLSYMLFRLVRRTSGISVEDGFGGAYLSRCRF